MDDAIKRGQDFTLETNLRDTSILDTLTRFKEAGYETGLIYMCLRSVKQSMDRVQKRVQNGGHFVDNDSIVYNFEEGLKNLEFFAERFDNVEIMKASKGIFNIKTILRVSAKNLVLHERNAPDWIRSVLQEVAKHFSIDTLDQKIDTGKSQRRRR